MKYYLKKKGTSRKLGRGISELNTAGYSIKIVINPSLPVEPNVRDRIINQQRGLFDKLNTLLREHYRLEQSVSNIKTKGTTKHRHKNEQLERE